MKTVVFPGCFESLEKISDLVVRAATKAGLDDRAVYAVQLAVDEACTNIIEHAYGGEGKGNIECSIQVCRGEIKIILRDHGLPFDPKKVRKPKTHVPLEDLEPRGLGIFFMRNMMDEVQFEFCSDVNILTMVKRSQE